MRSILVGFQCNNHCVFCAQGSLGDRSAAPSNPFIQEIIEEAARGESDRAIAFVGGEPTLNDELPKWIARAKTAGAEWVLLQTNGRRLAYPDFAGALACAGLDAVEISLHGSTAAMHEYHTDVPGGCAQTLLGIARAKEAGLRVGVTVVITRSNFRHLREIVALAHRQGAGAVQLSPALPLGSAHRDWARIVPAMEIVMPHLKSAIETARSLGVAVLAANQSTSAEVRRLFAGIGETEPASPAGVMQGSSLDKTRPKRPAPGLNEVRSAEKKTGDALRAIFPGIFEPEEARG